MFHVFLQQLQHTNIIQHNYASNLSQGRLWGPIFYLTTPSYQPFFRTTWVSWHQKGRTILDFNEATDDGVAVASAGPYANHLHLTPDR